MLRKATATLTLLWLLLTATVLADRPTISWGSRGEHVTAAQHQLYRWGYSSSAPTGYFGPITSTAVKWFQAKNGLASDGVVGRSTWLALGLWNSDQTAQKQTSTQTSAQDAELLARLIAAEARGEPWNGQVGVGAVVLNRTATSGFPSTLSGVMYQRYQFESVSNGLVWMRTPTATERSAAWTALSGQDPTGGALFFWNPSKPISSRWIWSRRVITRIGNHVFAI